MRRLALLFALSAVVGSCGGGDTTPPTTTVSPTTTSATTTATVLEAPMENRTTTSAVLQIPEQLADFGVQTVAVDGEPWLVAMANTPDLRRQGLMFVTDLADLDGMVFAFDRTARWSFWMKNTLIPLDIAFFAEDGSLLAVLQMEPCGDQDPCPSYGPDADSRYALEAPLGALIALDPAARLEL